MVSNKPTPPTQGQLAYLEALGYDGKRPKTIKEASALIDSLAEGHSPKEAEEQSMKKRFNCTTCLVIVTLIIIAIAVYIIATNPMLDL